MGYLKYIRDAWKQPKANMPELWRERLILWRKEPVTVRLERPTRIDRARSLGYKAKTGVFVVRQRVNRGGRKREDWAGGRRSKAQRRSKVLGKNYRQVAEERVQKKYLNCEILNSYWVAEDGRYMWFEVIVVDRDQPQIIKDKQLGFISKPAHKGRVHRGLTSAGKKSRGLRNKGKGAEKIRPGQRANKRLAK
ncbi:TPA: 50S ribosomal protein L15e [Candidatus Woesearchaeota archaeon]|nr:50S ribosomal protein L15e [Candidatus Woesearchaeota archaeon]